MFDEHYRYSEALLGHFQNAAPLFLAVFENAADPVGVEVYGTPSAPARKLIEGLGSPRNVTVVADSGA